MLRSHAAPPRSEPLPLVFGCLADPVRRRKVESALRDAATARWFSSFVDLREALETEIQRVVVAVVDMHDSTGASAHGFARTMADAYPGIGIVAYRHSRRDSEADVCQLGAAGVHDLLVEGLTDEGFLARETILGACRRGAGDVVMYELAKVLPERLLPFADTVVRNPSKSSIEKVTRHLNIHRQTPNSWCKKERFLRPEEVLMWCRLLLVASMLELTSRTLESIAVELEYASATSLRNQLRNYTGMTSREIRAAGLSAVMSVFVGRIAQRRAGLGGIIDAPADNTVIPIRVSGTR
jgi:AraC-like DNA-binding protein